MEKLRELKEFPEQLLNQAQDKFDAFGNRAREFGRRINVDIEALRKHGQIRIQNTRLRSTPDWIRRSIRLSLCLIVFGLLGHAVNWTSDPQVNTEIMQSCNWAAVTCIVVTAPFIGKVSEVSTWRIIGTILGGLYGFCTFEFGLHVISAEGSGIFLSLMAPTIIVATTYLAYKRSMEQLAKFMQLTYVIVGYGASASTSDVQALIRACMRISGIIAGGLLSLLFAVIILPRSANVETCRELKKALKLLIDLNHEVWKHTSNPVPRMEGTTNVYTRKASRKRISDHLTQTQELNTASFAFVTGDSQDRMRVPGGHTLHSDSNKVQVSEKILSNMYNALHKVEEMLEQCKGEVYVHHLWGLYFFVPGIHFFTLGKWHLPESDVRMLVLVLRRIVRLLWTLLLDFEEGFDENMMAVLDRYYPKPLMSELSLYMHRALVDLHAAFPSQTCMSVDNLLSFGQLVDCLIQISDTHNRNVAMTVRQQKEKQRARRQAPGGLASAASRDRYHSGDGSGRPRGGAAPSTDAEESAAPRSAGHRSGDLSRRNTGGSLTGAGGGPTTKGGASGRPSIGGSLVPMFLTQAAGLQGELAVLDLPPRRFMRAQAQARDSLELAEAQARGGDAQRPLTGQEQPAGGVEAAGTAAAASFVGFVPVLDGQAAAPDPLSGPAPNPAALLATSAVGSSAFARSASIAAAGTSPFAMQAMTPHSPAPLRRLATIVSEPDLVTRGGSALLEAGEDAANSQQLAQVGFGSTICPQPPQLGLPPLQQQGSSTSEPAETDTGAAWQSHARDSGGFAQVQLQRRRAPHTQDSLLQTGISHSGSLLVDDASALTSLTTSGGGGISGSAGGSNAQQMLDAAVPSGTGCSTAGSTAQQVLDASVLGSQQYQDWADASAACTMPEGPDLSRAQSDSVEVLARSFGNAAEVRSMLAHALGGGARLAGDAASSNPSVLELSATANTPTGCSTGGAGGGGCSPGGLSLPLPLTLTADGSPSELQDAISRARATDLMLSNMTLGGDLDGPGSKAISRAMSTDPATADGQSPQLMSAMHSSGGGAHADANAAGGGFTVDACFFEAELGVLSSGGFGSTHDLGPLLPVQQYGSVTGAAGVLHDPHDDVLHEQQQLASAAIAAAPHQAAAAARDLLFEGLLAGAAMPDPCMGQAQTVGEGGQGVGLDVPGAACTAGLEPVPLARSEEADGVTRAFEATALLNRRDTASGEETQGAGTAMGTEAGADAGTRSSAGSEARAGTGAVTNHVTISITDGHGSLAADEPSPLGWTVSARRSQSGGGALELQPLLAQPPEPTTNAPWAEAAVVTVADSGDEEHQPLLANGTCSAWGQPWQPRQPERPEAQPGQPGNEHANEWLAAQDTPPRSVVINVFPAKSSRNGSIDRSSRRSFSAGGSPPWDASHGNGVRGEDGGSGGGGRSVFSKAGRSSFARRLDRIGSESNEGDSETLRLLRGSVASVASDAPERRPPSILGLHIPATLGMQHPHPLSSRSDKSDDGATTGVAKTPAIALSRLDHITASQLLESLPRLMGDQPLPAQLNLASTVSSALIEPISFPPTSEGYVSQVRWYSFQFVMDEIVEELEEALLGSVSSARVTATSNSVMR